jgi:hypothetical protein
MMMNVLAETTPIVKVKCININNSNKPRKHVENYGEDLNNELNSQIPVPIVHLVQSSKPCDYSNGKKRKYVNDDDNRNDERDSNFYPLESFFKKNKVESYDVEVNYQTSNKCLNENELSEKEIWMLVNQYDDLFEWESIGMHLGLSKTDLQIIKYEHLDKLDLGGLKESLYQVFLKWRMYEPENFNINFLLKFFKTKLNKTNEFIESIKTRMSSKTSQNSAKLMNFYFKCLKEGKKMSCKFDDDYLRINLNESELWKASEVLSMDWKSIGRFLGISESDLKNIEIKYLRTDGLRECCYQTLLLWSEQFYDQTYLDYLCTLLIELRYNFYAKKLIENICFN